MGDFCRQIIFIILISLFMTSCSPFLSKKSSIILILVESFPEQNYLCSEPRLIEDLEDLKSSCDQFVRFTHSFAPSTLHQPVISSLFTGVSIAEHGVTHNGSLGISGRFQTLSEHALSQGMRTAFFSGGIPLIDKFGVSQGYEFFDDSFAGDKKIPFRSFLETIEKSLKWIDGEVGRESFFVTYYVPDILHSELITTTDLGRERPQTKASQIQEINESLNHLIKELKKRKLWDKSHVVLLGLGGESSGIEEDNLINSSKLRVPLQVKLAKKVSSNLDKYESRLLSFHKLGQWLQQLIFYKPTQGALLFSAPKEEPLIALRSDKLKWLKLFSSTVYGLRKKQYLFTFTPDLKVYDTFADAREVEPLSQEEGRGLAIKYEIDDKVKKYFGNKCLYESVRNEVFQDGKYGLCSFSKKEFNYIPQIGLLKEWSEQLSATESLKDDLDKLIFKEETKRSLIVQGWLSTLALKEKQWDSLGSLGKISKNSYIKIVAARNKKEEVKEGPKGCLSYFLSLTEDTSNFYRKCDNSELRKVVEGLSSLRLKQKPSNSFWEQVYRIKNNRRAKNINFKMNFINDVKKPFEFDPTLAELYFYLPENKEYLSLINIDES